MTTELNKLDLDIMLKLDQIEYKYLILYMELTQISIGGFVIYPEKKQGTNIVSIFTKTKPATMTCKQYS